MCSEEIQVSTLQEFIDTVVEPLNPFPRTEFDKQPNRYRLNVFLHRYGKLLPWLKEQYPEFARIMAEIMVAYQYNMVTDTILRLMGAEIQEKVKPYLRNVI